MTHENHANENRGRQPDNLPNLFRANQIAIIEKESIKARKAPTKRFVSFCLSTLVNKFTGWAKHPVQSSKQAVSTACKRMKTERLVQQQFPFGD